MDGIDLLSKKRFIYTFFCTANWSWLRFIDISNKIIPSQINGFSATTTKKTLLNKILTVIGTVWNYFTQMLLLLTNNFSIFSLPMNRKMKKKRMRKNRETINVSWTNKQTQLNTKKKKDCWKQLNESKWRKKFYFYHWILWVCICKVGKVSFCTCLKMQSNFIAHK